MHSGIPPPILAVFAIIGLAAFFVLTVFVNEIKPSVNSDEDVMIDSAQMLAEIAANDLSKARSTTAILRAR